MSDGDDRGFLKFHSKPKRVTELKTEKIWDNLPQVRSTKLSLSFRKRLREYKDAGRWRTF